MHVCRFLQLQGALPPPGPPPLGITNSAGWQLCIAVLFDIECYSQDYDEEEEEESGRPKKKKRKGALGFIIDEAGKHSLTLVKY